MNHKEFRAAQARLGLTDGKLAKLLGVSDARVIRRWKQPPDTQTGRPPNPIACKVLQWMLKDGRPDEWPDPPGD